MVGPDRVLRLARLVLVEMSPSVARALESSELKRLGGGDKGALLLSGYGLWLVPAEWCRGCRWGPLH